MKYEVRMWQTDPVAASIADLIHERLDYGQERFGPFTDTKNEIDILEEVLDTAIYAARRLVELRQGRQCVCPDRPQGHEHVVCDEPDEAGP